MCAVKQHVKRPTEDLNLTEAAAHTLTERNTKPVRATSVCAVTGECGDTTDQSRGPIPCRRNQSRKVETNVLKRVINSESLTWSVFCVFVCECWQHCSVADTRPSTVCLSVRHNSGEIENNVAVMSATLSGTVVILSLFRSRVGQWLTMQATVVIICTSHSTCHCSHPQVCSVSLTVT